LRDYIPDEFLHFINPLLEIIYLPLQMGFASLLCCHSAANYTLDAPLITWESRVLKKRPGCPSQRITQHPMSRLLEGGDVVALL
jgi:hypothetical protein